MNDPAVKWVWERTDAARSGAAGDLARLFRNEPVKQPGVLAIGAPSAQATVLAREVIQNSWDAADDLREDLRREQLRAERRGRSLGISPFVPPPFEIRFDFRTAVGSTKDEIVRRLALNEHANRLGGGVDRRKVGLRKDDCLGTLGDSDAELAYMVIEEEAASGMYGPWRGDESKMYRALCAIGVTSGTEGRGGSYGYGKAGMIRGSATRTVVAYTCFRERRDDPGATRRLLGMTYWGRHDYCGEGFTGFARFGKEKNGGEVVPFENEEADEQAAMLGLRARSPDEIDQLGTTFLLIEPTVQPEELITAIERSWWPALEERRLQFNTYVQTPAGAVLHPRPRHDPVLRTFIDAYENATLPAAIGEGRRGEFPGLGTIGLVSDIEGWSYAEQIGDTEEQGIDHCSLVALMRKPHMVVEYLKVSRATPPHVRGAFVADFSINDALRETEPKGHDAWDYKAGDTDEESRRTAKKVRDRIAEKVRRYKKELKPPSPPVEGVVLPEFDRLMRKLMSGPIKDRPDLSPRLVTIRPDFNLEVAGPDEVRVVGKAEFGLSEHFEGEAAWIEVSIRYSFVEDDRAGKRAELEVVPPVDFVEINGKYRGIIRSRDQVLFKFKTQPYRADWSGRLITGAEIVNEEEA